MRCLSLLRSFQKRIVCPFDSDRARFVSAAYPSRLLRSCHFYPAKGKKKEGALRKIFYRARSQLARKGRHSKQKGATEHPDCPDLTKEKKRKKKKKDEPKTKVIRQDAVLQRSLDTGGIVHSAPSYFLPSAASSSHLLEGSMNTTPGAPMWALFVTESTINKKVGQLRWSLAIMERGPIQSSYVTDPKTQKIYVYLRDSVAAFHQPHGAAPSLLFPPFLLQVE